MNISKRPYIPNGSSNPIWDQQVPYGCRLLPQLVDERAARTPEALVGMVAKSTDLSQGFSNITIGQLSNAVNYMSWWIDSTIGKRRGSEIMAYMGPGDFRYTVMLLVAIKTGFPVLFPSGRNSQANNLSLMEDANCSTVLYAAPYGSKAAELLKHRPLRVHEIPTWNVMSTSSSELYPYNKSWEEAKDDIAVVIHTSGSTGNPKPYSYNNRILGLNDGARLLPPIDGRRAVSSGLVAGMPGDYFFTAFPAFHAAGLFARLLPITHESVIVTGPPDIPPNGKLVLDIMRLVEIKRGHMPPSLIEDIIKHYSKELLEYSGPLDLLYYGGGPLAPFAGNFIQENLPKVKLVSSIGQTEAVAFTCLEPCPGDFNYFEWYPNLGITMELVDPGETLYELVVKRDPKVEWMQGAFIIHPHLQEWRTKDLYKQHPSKKNLWSFVGRRDDVIVLSNGEKFNPVGMEQKILSHPLLSGALVVGYGRFQCALILEGKEQAASPKQIIDEVWPIIEEANAAAPSHAKIHRRLIMTTSPSKPFPRTSKGTVMRFAANKAYAEEIENLYASNTIDQDMPPLDSTDPSRIAQFVRDCITIQLPEVKFSDTDDLFSLGMDSLQTTQLSNALTLAIRPHTSDSSTEVSTSLIYENPTAEKLSNVVQHALSVGGTQEQVARDTRKMSLMQELVSKYSSGFPEKSRAVARPPGGLKNVVVTGTTGSLGYYLLLSLLKDAQIGTIYCLNRSGEAKENFWSRYEKREDKVTLPEGKVKFLKVSFGDDLFGLDNESFNELLAEVDIIIHNAWKVNFNHDLQTFEPQIKGVHTFVSLCFSSLRQPSLYFTSSIGAVGNLRNVTGAETVPEIVQTDPKVVNINQGYGASKWVVENILDTVHRQHNLDLNVLRLGQITGPVRDELGEWNRNEWIPSMFLTSKAMGVVPEMLGLRSVDWIPVDSLADIIVEITQAPKIPTSDGGAPVFNLVNPRPVSYQSLTPAIKAYWGDSVRVVPFEEWVDQLLKLDRNEVGVFKKYPALKLRYMFENLRAGSGGQKSMVWETDRSRAASRKMRELESITGAMAKTWLRQWKL